jgi:hypothetical protein
VEALRGEKSVPPRRRVVSKTASEYLVEALEKTGVKRV